LVKATFEKRRQKGDFDKFLRDGKSSQSPTKFEQSIAYEDLLALSNDQSVSSPHSADNLDLILVPSFHSWDGCYANNGWMQECPDPLTRLTWDNAILISPKLAKELEASSGVQILSSPTMLNKQGVIAPDTAIFNLGKENAPMARIKVGDTVVEGPLHVQPGLANYSIVASLGFGRRKVGRVGEGTGFDAYPLLEGGERIVSGAQLDLEGLGRMKLANVQEHWSMEGRAIIREGTTEEYEKKPDFVAKMGMESHSPPVYGKDKGMSLQEKATTTPRGASSYEHPDHKYEGSDVYGLHQWGMTIDLNRCTGCSACVVACQSENNIPIVGKDQVLRGREMHWIRMDRYFSSEERDGAEIPEDVQVSFQGMACSQCETAPCESVCPVNATVHDEEGLNAMAYNRCVGTRYCANNCPYKVRRFNFFDWNKRAIGEFYEGPLGDKNDPLPSLQKNPDVSVRMRGVMEKCTYCVQRIQEAKIRTKVKVQQAKQLATGENGAELKLEREDLKVPDGTIKPACQQVCPADAIVFGDISDPDSEVSKLKTSNRDYSVLGYLETRPRTTYLAKIRNPNPAMPNSYSTPHAAGEYDRRAHSGTGSHGHGDDQTESGGHHK
jgi:molybdopterin-containing oxidoreductase family iron-sulfur binding subunit